MGWMLTILTVWTLWWSPARAAPPEEGYRSLVALGDLAVPALREAGCRAEASPHRAQAVLALQEIGSEEAQAALRHVARCAADLDPDVHRWAVQAAAALTDEPAVVAVLLAEHEAYPDLVREVQDRARELWRAERFEARDWLLAPSGDSAWAEELARRFPDMVPVRALARAVARHRDPGRRVLAANILLTLPPGHGLGDALVDAHRFDPAAASMPWTGRPQVGRFTLTESRSRMLASELVAWLITSRSALDPELAAVAWGFVPAGTKALGAPASRADWLHAWATFASGPEMEERLPLPVLPAGLGSAWAAETAFQASIEARDAYGIARAAANPSRILRQRAHAQLDGYRRGARRRGLRDAYTVLWQRLDEHSGPRAYAEVATIVAEGRGSVKWRDVAPLGHALIEQYIRADRWGRWSALMAYEDGLLELQDAYDVGGTIPGCCGDGWLYWLGRKDGRAAVRRRLRRLGMHRLPHYATLVQNQRR